MSIVRLGGLLVIVGMAALPFASCGGVDFVGHEILRNKAPDPEKAAEGMMGGLLTGLEGAAEASGKPGGGPKIRPSGSGRLDTLFEGDDRWLHWLYLGAFGLGVLALLLRVPRGAAAILGVVGIAATVLFLNRFESRIRGESSGGPAIAELKWEAGAYLTLAGFAGVLLGGAGLRLGGGGSTGKAT